MTITPKEISKSIHLASDIARPSPMAILSHIIIGNGQIVASDIENQVTIAAPFDFPAFCVPAARLKSILATLPEDAPLKLDQKDGKLLVKSGRSKFTVQTLPMDDFPMMELGGGKAKVTLDQAKLKKQLHDVQHAMGNTQAKPMLNGVFIESKGGKLTAVGCDGARLAMREEDFDGEQFEFILPRNTVARLHKILGDGVATLTIHVDKVVFDLGGTVFATKLIEQKYPDYRRILPKPAHKILVDREIFTEAFDRSAVVLEKNRAARVTIGRMIAVQCQNNGEVASDEFEASYQGEAFEIGLNPDYMREAMSAIGGDEVEFGFSGPKAAVTLEGNGVKTVVMQLVI